MTITTTVTWDDLIAEAAEQRHDYEQAFEELADAAQDEFGDDWQDEPTPGTPDSMDDDAKRLAAYQDQAEVLDQGIKTMQKREHILDRLRDEYGDGAFEVKMLSGGETMDIETELRMEAQSKGIDLNVIQNKRNVLTVDAATVDAPEGLPRDGDGSPEPSESPTALVNSLWDFVERFNSAGATDFRAEGFGEDSPAPTTQPGSSATPDNFDARVSPSDPDATSTPPPGEDS